MEEKALDIHKNIERMVTGMLELGGGVIVHDDGHVSWATSPTESVQIATGKEDLTLCTYKTDCKIPNAILINPLAESVGKPTSEKIWFYQVTGLVYSKTAAQVIYRLLETAVAAYTGNLEIKDPCFIHALSGIIGYVDNKTDKEIKLLSKKTRDYGEVLDEKILIEFDLIRKANILDFVSITYNKLSRTATLRTCFADPEEDFKKQFGNRIRKKTWEMLETLIKEIYAVEDLTKPIIEVQIKDLKCPQFRAYMEVFVKAWSFMMPYLGHVFSEDTAEFMNGEIVFLESCIPNLTKYAEKGMWANLSTTKPIEMIDGTTVDRNTEILSNAVDRSVARKEASRAERDERVDRVAAVRQFDDRPNDVVRERRPDDNDTRREQNRPVGLSNEAPSTMEVLRARRGERYEDRGSRRDWDRDRGRDRDRDYDRDYDCDRDRGRSRDRRYRDDYDDYDRGRSRRPASVLEIARQVEDERRYYRGRGGDRRRGESYFDSIV